MSEMSHQELLKEIKRSNSLGILLIYTHAVASALVVIGGSWWFSLLIRRIVNNKCGEFIDEIRYWNLYISPFFIYVGIVCLIGTVKVILGMKPDKSLQSTAKSSAESKREPNK
jgi:hypothetical protein